MEKIAIVIVQIMIWIALILAVRSVGYTEPIYYIGAISAYYGFMITIKAGRNLFEQTEFYKKNINFMFFLSSLSIIICYFATLTFFFPPKHIEIIPTTIVGEAIENKPSEPVKSKEDLDIDSIFLTKEEIDKTLDNLPTFKDKTNFKLDDLVVSTTSNKNISKEYLHKLTLEAARIEAQYYLINEDYKRNILSEELLLKKIQLIKERSNSLPKNIINDKIFPTNKETQ